MNVRILILIAMLTCPAAAFDGVHGPVGNDDGGIIPWSREAERSAFDIAQANCGRFNTYAVFSSARREYGGYIVYRCQWQPARRAWSTFHILN
jgi:hypothetical protein